MSGRASFPAAGACCGGRQKVGAVEGIPILIDSGARGIVSGLARKWSGRLLPDCRMKGLRPFFTFGVERIRAATVMERPLSSLRFNR